MNKPSPQVTRICCQNMISRSTVSQSGSLWFSPGLDDLGAAETMANRKNHAMDRATRVQGSITSRNCCSVSRLQRQIASLGMTPPELLAIWHTIHIPIGMALFRLPF